MERDVTAKGVEHPDCPDRTAQSTCSTAFEITEAPCPNVTCNIVASNTAVTEGERVTLRVTATGDSNFSYSWTTTGGRLSTTTGREVALDTHRVWVILSDPTPVDMETLVGTLRSDHDLSEGRRFQFRDVDVIEFHR